MEMDRKDEEIARLKDEVARVRGSSPRAPPEVPDSDNGSVPLCHPRVCRVKGRPVDAFTGEDPECRIDDLLPTLTRAADWNEWTKEELLLLRGALERPCSASVESSQWRGEGDI